MAIVRVRHRHRFTIIAQGALEDERLSFGALGLLAYLLSKPDDWRIYVRNLGGARPGAGRDFLYARFAELKAAGYVRTIRDRDRVTGALGDVDYEVSELPGADIAPHPGKPEVVAEIPPPHPALPDPANPPLLKTEVLPKTERGKINAGAEKPHGLAALTLGVTPPTWLRMDAWGDYVQHRIEKRNRLTKTGIRAAFLKLERLRAAGNDPHDVLRESIENGWLGLFPLKAQRGAARSAASGDALAQRLANREK